MVMLDSAAASYGLVKCRRGGCGLRWWDIRQRAAAPSNVRAAWVFAHYLAADCVPLVPSVRVFMSVSREHSECAPS
jgi:hypothetical protein